jgi:hypothetical protein
MLPRISLLFPKGNRVLGNSENMARAERRTRGEVRDAELVCHKRVAVEWGCPEVRCRGVTIKLCPTCVGKLSES